MAGAYRRKAPRAHPVGGASLRALSSSSMPLSARERSQAELALGKLCQKHVPPAMVGQVRLEYEIDGITAILFERRAAMAATKAR